MHRLRLMFGKVPHKNRGHMIVSVTFADTECLAILVAVQEVVQRSLAAREEAYDASVHQCHMSRPMS